MKAIIIRIAPLTSPPISFVDAEIPSNEEEITSENRKPSSDNKEQKWPHRIQAGCAILLVIITFLYTYYAREQAAHMEAAVRMAKGQVTEMEERCQGS